MGMRVGKVEEMEKMEEKEVGEFVGERSEVKTLIMTPPNDLELSDLHTAMFYGDLVDSGMMKEDGCLWVKTRQGKFLLIVRRLEWVDGRLTEEERMAKEEMMGDGAVEDEKYFYHPDEKWEEFEGDGEPPWVDEPPAREYEDWPEPDYSPEDPPL